MTMKAQTKPLIDALPGGATGATVTVEPLNGGEAQAPPAMMETHEPRSGRPGAGARHRRAALPLDVGPPSRLS